MCWVLWAGHSNNACKQMCELFLHYSYDAVPKCLLSTELQVVLWCQIHFFELFIFIFIWLSSPIYLTHSTQARFPFAAKTAHELVFTEHVGRTLDSGGGQFQSLSILVGILRPEAMQVSSQQQRAAVGILWQFLRDVRRTEGGKQ